MPWVGQSRNVQVVHLDQSIFISHRPVLNSSKLKLNLHFLKELIQKSEHNNNKTIIFMRLCPFLLKIESLFL